MIFFINLTFASYMPYNPKMSILTHGNLFTNSL